MTGMSRALMGYIVDEVFDGAIEDTKVIEDIYAAIKRHEPGDEASAKIIDQMLEEPGWSNNSRSKLALTVAARAIRRGRLLSSHEKWENIKSFCEAHGDE